MPDAYTNTRSSSWGEGSEQPVCQPVGERLFKDRSDASWRAHEGQAPPEVRAEAVLCPRSSGSRLGYDDPKVPEREYTEICKLVHAFYISSWAKFTTRFYPIASPYGCSSPIRLVVATNPGAQGRRSIDRGRSQRPGTATGRSWRRCHSTVDLGRARRTWGGGFGAAMPRAQRKQAAVGGGLLSR